MGQYKPQHTVMNNHPDEQTIVWRRLHPLSILYRVTTTLPGLAFAIIVGFRRTEDVINIILTIVIGVVLLPAILLRHWFFQYALTSSHLMIEYGVFSRTTRNIPFERIQNVEVHQNPLHKLLGIAKLTVETAGSAGPEGQLEYIALQDAEMLRHAIRQVQQKPVAAHTTPLVVDNEHVAEIPPTPAETELYNLPFRRLALAGALHFRPWLMIGAVWIVQQMAEVLPDWLFVSFRSGVEVLKQMDTVTFIAALAAMLISAALMSWIAGIILDINRLFRYRLTLQSKKLHKRQGLLSTTDNTVPVRRLQMAAIVASNPIVRLLGWRKLELYTAAQAGDESATHLKIPIGRAEELMDIVRQIWHNTPPLLYRNVSRLTIRRAFVRYELAVLGISIPAVWYLPQTAFALLLLPMLYYAAVLRYQARGYAIEGGMVYIRQGFWRERLMMIPIEKIQTVEISASLFQRQLSLATLRLDISSTSMWEDPKVVDIDAEDARVMMQELLSVL